MFALSLSKRVFPRKAAQGEVCLISFVYQLYVVKPSVGQGCQDSTFFLGFDVFRSSAVPIYSWHSIPGEVQGLVAYCGSSPRCGGRCCFRDSFSG